jgi:hypothetical protein
LDQQYGHELVNSLRSFAGQSEDVDGTVRLLEAVADFTTDDRQENAYAALADVLTRAGRKAEAWDALRRAVLPMQVRQGHLSNEAAALVNLSQELGRLEDVKAAARQAMDENATWAACGELLVAMAEQRAGSETELVQVAERFRNDSTYAASVQNSQGILRSELARCTAEPALRLAASLWESEFDEMQANGAYNYDYRQSGELAQVYAKLGEREKARKLWLEAGTSLPDVYGGDYVMVQSFERREHIGPMLLEAGFALDALRLFEQNRDAAGLPQAEQYQFPQRVERQQDARREAILGVLAEGLDEALESLEESLASAEVADLAHFFAVADRPWTDAQSSRIPEHVRGNSPPTVLLLPALVRHAAAKQRTGALSEALAKQIAAHPGDEHVAAFAILLPVWQGEADAPTDALEGLSRSNDSGIRALALATLGRQEPPAADEAESPE